MRYPPACYQMGTTIAQPFPHRRPAQQRGLALWVYGTVLAQSACPHAVVAALLPLAAWHTLRQYRREWLRAGVDKAAPCHSQVEVTPCFAPLLRWVLAWWQGPTLALAIDATTQADRLSARVISVLYRGRAIPVAGHLLPGKQPGPWLPARLALRGLLSPVVPSSWTALVLVDRGLGSPRLWRTIRAMGWHPLRRLQRPCSVPPAGQGRHARVAARARPWVRLGGRGAAVRRPGAAGAGDGAGGMGHGPARAVGLGDRSAADGSRRVRVWLAGVDRRGLSGVEGRGLAVAAHAARGPGAGGAALGGAGGGDAVGAGVWDTGGRCCHAGRAAGTGAHTAASR